MQSLTARSTPVFGSKQCSVRSSQRSLKVVAMAKKDIHPKWHSEAKVMCNGEEVLTTSGTQGSYTVDIWSGNHPFFQGATSTVVTDEGRVNRFKRRFAGLDSLATIDTITSVREAKDAKDAKAAAAKK
ncbi:50S ribosomal protein L31 [Chlorella vulgaris]